MGRLFWLGGNVPDVVVVMSVFGVHVAVVVMSVLSLHVAVVVMSVLSLHIVMAVSARTISERRHRHSRH